MKNRVHLILDDYKSDDPTVYTVIDGVVVIEDTDEDTTSGTQTEITLPENDASASQGAATNTPLACSTKKQCLTSQSCGSNEDQKNCTRNEEHMESFTKNNDASTSQDTATNTPLACSTKKQSSTSQSCGSNEDQMNCTRNEEHMESLAKNNKNSNLPSVNTLKNVNKVSGIACPVCQQSFSGQSKSSTFLQHYTLVHLLVRVSCKKCAISNNDTNSLNHLRNQNHTIKCPFCPPSQKEWRFQDLAEHINGHKEQFDGKSYACPYRCDKILKTSKDFIHHYNSRHERNIFQHYNCDLCERTGKHVQLSVKNSLAHYVAEHGGVVTKDVYEAFAQSKYFRTVARFDKDQLPSITGEGSAQSAMPSTANDKTSKPSSSSEKMHVATNVIRNTRSSSSSKTNRCSSSNDGNFLPSVSCSQSSSSSKDDQPLRSSDMLSSSGNKNKTSLFSTKDKSALPSIPNTKSPLQNRNKSPASSNDKYNPFSNSTCMNNFASSSSNDKNIPPSFSGGGKNSRSFSSSRNNVTTSNDNDNSTTASKNIFVVPSGCTDRRDKTNASSAANSSNNQKSATASLKDITGLPSISDNWTNTESSSSTKRSASTSNSNSISSTSGNDTIVLQPSSNDQRNTGSSCRDGTNWSTAANNSDNHNLPSSSSKDKHGLLSISNTHLSSNKHNLPLSNLNKTRKAPNDNELSSISNDRQNDESSPYNFRSSSRSKKVCLSGDTLPFRTDRHQSSHSSDQRIKDIITNSLASATADTNSCVSKGADSTNVASTTSTSKEVLKNSSHFSTTTSWLTAHSHSADGANSSPHQGTNHRGHPTKTSQSKAEARGKNLADKMDELTYFSGARSRTKSAPSSGKRKRVSSPCSVQEENQPSCSVQKKNCHSANDRHSCSSQCKSTDVHARHNPHKRPRTKSAPSTTLPTTSARASNSRQVLSNLENSDNLPSDSLQNLSNFSHIIFIDLDNWSRFFSLPYPLSPTVFVWGFCGGSYINKRTWSVHFRALVQEKRFFQHPKCGNSKNAADFALCVQAARLDLQLPVRIPFTILSGDRGFGELRDQLKSSARQIHLVDPHQEEQDMLYAILASIGDK